MARVFVVLLTICAVVLFWQQQQSAQLTGRQERSIALLTRENERLRSLVAEAEQKKTAAATQARRTEIEKIVEEIRELPFKKPVDYRILGRLEIQGFVAKKLSEVYSDADFSHQSAAFGRLGLLPEDFPLKQTLVELLGEQVAALFDQHTGGLYMFADASLENAQNRVVLAHELTHALTDQHFTLKRLPLELKTNDDRATAAAALVEGDATMVMSAYMMRNFSLGALKDNLAAAVGQDMKALQHAPRYLRETLIFPYLRGQEFCLALMTEGGSEAIDRAYNDPPTSTTQILHPHKYLQEPREQPLTVEGEAISARERLPTVDNVVGELGIRILLAEALGEKHPSARTAEGWRGDRYLCWGMGEALVWQTLWASEAEAAEFFAAQQEVLLKRYRPRDPLQSPDRFEAAEPRKVTLVREGTKVRLVDVPDAAWAEAVDSALR